MVLFITLFLAPLAALSLGRGLLFRLFFGALTPLVHYQHQQHRGARDRPCECYLVMAPTSAVVIGLRGYRAPASRAVAATFLERRARHFAGEAVQKKQLITCEAKTFDLGSTPV